MNLRQLDFRDLEIRVAAAEAAGVDVVGLSAAEYFEVSIEEVTQAMRAHVKYIAFSLLYLNQELN